MRRPILGLTCLLSLSLSASAETFQLVEAYRYQYYGVRIRDPQNCEGLDDRIEEFRYDLEPMNGSLDRTFRCLETRARGISIHNATIDEDAIDVRLRTMTGLSSGALVPGGEATGTGENFERVTFDLNQTTKFRITGSARATFEGDPVPVDELYLDAGFILEGAAETRVELAFSEQLPGEGSLDQEIICPPGRYTFAAAATVLSCELDLQQPQQVAADSEVEVRVAVVYCPGDLNIDNQCDVEDLARLLAHFGMSSIERNHGDLDGNRRVDAADLSLLLAAFGNGCW